MGAVTLISGGARSGKSAQAIALALNAAGTRRFFIATAEPLDIEMRERIAHHRAQRPSEFTTVEEPLALGVALAALAGRADVAVVDCLTLWVSNLISAAQSDDAICAQARALALTIGGAPFDTVVVTSEVGSGIVPDNAVARRFRDLLGWTNQTVAQVAGQVLLMVAGCPLRVK